MAKLIYMATTSLDGYTADASGNFDWSAPSPELHQFINDVVRPAGTHLQGRRMYETMLYWENPPDLAEQPPFARDFAAIWQAVDKVVYSKTLQNVSSRKTRLEREFDLDEVKAMKSGADRDIYVAGANLAAQAIKAGLVDEYQLYLVPIIIGSGNAALPNDARIELELLDERRFDNGTVYVRYQAS